MFNANGKIQTYTVCPPRSYKILRHSLCIYLLEPVVYIISEIYVTSLTYIYSFLTFQLEQPVYVSQYATLLPQFYGTSGDSPAKLVGWGYERSGGSVQTTLQEVNLKIFSHEECKRLHRLEVFPSNICAGVIGGGQGQCSVNHLFLLLFSLIN